MFDHPLANNQSNQNNNNNKNNNKKTTRRTKARTTTKMQKKASLSMQGEISAVDPEVSNSTEHFLCNGPLSVCVHTRHELCPGHCFFCHLCKTHSPPILLMPRWPLRPQPFSRELGNGWNTVSRVLVRKRELTEFCGKLGEFWKKLGEFVMAHKS